MNLQELSDAATPGEWRAVDWEAEDEGWMLVDADSVSSFYRLIAESLRQGHDHGEADAKFIAALVNGFRSGALVVSGDTTGGDE